MPRRAAIILLFANDGLDILGQVNTVYRATQFRINCRNPISFLACETQRWVYFSTPEFVSFPGQRKDAIGKARIVLDVQNDHTHAVKWAACPVTGKADPGLASDENRGTAPILFRYHRRASQMRYISKSYGTSLRATHVCGASVGRTSAIKRHYGPFVAYLAALRYNSPFSFLTRIEEKR